MTPFLTAVWSDLILISYAVPDEALLPYLAPGLELDRWAGSAWCSLVAFDFHQARVLGWSVPYPRSLCDFPEFNLRFYVRQGDKRGVVFIRELAPSPFVCGIARLLYNEQYSRAQMSSRVTQIGDLRRVRHDFTVDGKAHMAAVTAHGPAFQPERSTFAHWVKEQEMGFGTTHGGTLTRYRVWHPTWRIYEIADHQLGVSFAHLYGEQWHFLQGRAPNSIVLAEGSHIAIFPNEQS